jgi:3-oxoacyl-[acyl-carrier protein] reductase
LAYYREQKMNDTRRTAFITGSGRNIGKAIALSLAADGFNVIINGSTRRELCDPVAEEARALGIEATVLMGDISDPAAISQMTGAALEQFGAVDVLVNNAAMRPRQSFLEMSEADWDLVFDTNLKSVFRLSQAFLPGMIDKGWGRVIGFTGMNAIKGHAGRVHGSAVKHGVWGMVKAMASEFGPNGITVNAVSPGPILGDRDSQEKAAEISGDVKYIPLGRLGAPEEVAAVVSMLASDRGGFVNGQMIQVNGGAAM